MKTRAVDRAGRELAAGLIVTRYQTRWRFASSLWTKRAGSGCSKRGGIAVIAARDLPHLDSRDQHTPWHMSSPHFSPPVSEVEDVSIIQSLGFNPTSSTSTSGNPTMPLPTEDNLPVNAPAGPSTSHTQPAESGISAEEMLQKFKQLGAEAKAEEGDEGDDDDDDEGEVDGEGAIGAGGQAGVGAAGAGGESGAGKKKKKGKAGKAVQKLK